MAANKHAFRLRLITYDPHGCVRDTKIIPPNHVGRLDGFMIKVEPSRRWRYRPLFFRGFVSNGMQSYVRRFTGDIYLHFGQRSWLQYKMNKCDPRHGGRPELSLQPPDRGYVIVDGGRMGVSFDFIDADGKRVTDEDLW